MTSIDVELDDPGALERADPSGMLRTILGTAGQCQEGYVIGTGTEGLPDVSSIASVVVCGMGGSGVAGDMIRALYRDRLGIPLDVVKDAALPEYCGLDSLVVCSSFSGNTAETIACFDTAASRGCRVLVVASGGELAEKAAGGGTAVVRIPSWPPAPRAALGLLLFGALGALETMGVVPSVQDDLEEVEGVLGALAGEIDPGNPEASNPAKEMARWIGKRIPVVWGADGLGSVAAVRWKASLNENAKVPAFAAALPELDHNEVVGWSEGAGDPFVVVALRHPGEHADVALRFPLSLRIASESGLEAREVSARGDSGLARLLSLTMLGDATATYLGLTLGFDPTPIEAIVRLKKALEEAGG